MALGDGIRRNIAHVEPAERTMLKDALVAMNQRFFPGIRTDTPPGGVSWWFKQDEIHQATHVHGGPEFVPWHREIVNRLEGMLRQINPQLSLHYWDWTQDPRAIPNANLGGGTTGVLNLFTPGFMGYGGVPSAVIGEPWLSAGYYVPAAVLDRIATGNPADPPSSVVRRVGQLGTVPASVAGDNAIVSAANYPAMRGLLEGVHNSMHGFVNMGSQHTSFRDPFVFLLHSNVDRLYARWQTDPAHPQRLDANFVYGPEGVSLNGNIEPWSTGHSVDQFGVFHDTRPWFTPADGEPGLPKTYKHPSQVAPPLYDTSNLKLDVLVHLQGIGDVASRDDQFAGTRGQSRRLEGFQLQFNPLIPGLGMRYMAHLQGIADVPFVNAGQFIGTRGQSRRLEGFAIQLTGPVAANFNVVYMAHLQGTGDTSFFQNGQFCGTRGMSRRVEGILVRVSPKTYQ